MPGGDSILGKIQNIIEAETFANFRKNQGGGGGMGYESNSFHENLHSRKGQDVREIEDLFLYNYLIAYFALIKNAFSCNPIGVDFEVAFTVYKERD